MGHTHKAIDAMQAVHHGHVRLAGAELGVESFGLQVLDFPAGFTDYPEHDHAEDGQEEVYVVLDGAGTFAVDGEAVPVTAGHMLRVSADSRRRLQPGDSGIRVLAIGCARDRAYERPEGFRLAVRS